MIKLVQKTLKGATFAYVIFAVGIWALDYFQIDVAPFVEWAGLPADFLGATGIASGIGLTVYQVLRTAQLTLANNTNTAVSTVNKSLLSVLTKMETIQAESQLSTEQTKKMLSETNVMLKSVIEFEKLLAEKNKSSRLLNEESKAELDKWIKKVEIRLREIHNETV
jgi:hypothetical protein